MFQWHWDKQHGWLLKRRSETANIPQRKRRGRRVKEKGKRREREREREERKGK